MWVYVFDYVNGRILEFFIKWNPEEDLDRLVCDYVEKENLRESDYYYMASNERLEITKYDENGIQTCND